jgi:hypothetical protein
VQHSVDHAICALRNRIERFINRLKNSRRGATRYDHTASSFLSFAMLAAIRQWINFGPHGLVAACPQVVEPAPTVASDSDPGSDLAVLGAQAGRRPIDQLGGRQGRDVGVHALVVAPHRPRQLGDGFRGCRRRWRSSSRLGVRTLARPAQLSNET